MLDRIEWKIPVSQTALLFCYNPLFSPILTITLLSPLPPLLQDEKTIDAKALLQKYLRKLTVDNVSVLVRLCFVFV
jgi:hypothetical protein